MQSTEFGNSPGDEAGGWGAALKKIVSVPSDIKTVHSVHFSRVVLFCHPHQQLFMHSVFTACQK